eukprot:2498626-Amphidinium_carterae.1
MHHTARCEVAMPPAFLVKIRLQRCFQNVQTCRDLILVCPVGFCVRCSCDCSHGSEYDSSTLE